jgi:hypothetical protein
MHARVRASATPLLACTRTVLDAPARRRLVVYDKPWLLAAVRLRGWVLGVRLPPAMTLGLRAAAQLLQPGVDGAPAMLPRPGVRHRRGHLRCSATLVPSTCATFPRPVTLQQLLLPELLEPPCDGADLERPARRIGEPPADAEAAAGRLVEKGLATREGDLAAPSRAALEFDRLWPVPL